MFLEFYKESGMFLYLLENDILNVVLEILENFSFEDV